MPGLTDPKAEAALRAGGLRIRREVHDDTLPSPERAWRVTAGVQEPTSRVPFAAVDLSRAVDAEWRRLAQRVGVVDAEGVFLIALGRRASWVEVGLSEQSSLAAHLTGTHDRPGHAEFVTMARDGSAMCGVTSEEDEVWLVVDDALIHARPRPRPVIDPADVDLASLGPLQIDDLFAPDRRNPDTADGWVLLGYHRNARYLARLHDISAEAARSILPAFDTGSATEPAGGVVLDEEQALRIGAALGLPVDPRRLVYVLEHQSADARNQQSRDRKLPR